ncbi:putative zinc finger protein [Orchesella cincta]|uniref:Putative zinc finger protein n=1 Tax=Orchesella cincta TaxID=48709 RepID=A0A1D2MAT9_ORCCI|nr:putative zinc finger protein [Orchesella cincta]
MMTSSCIQSTESTKCFICTRDTQLAEASRLGHQLTGVESTLKCQLSIILLLRKILGINQELITELLSGTGNPSEWGIKLCTPCLSLFREAEFIHRRLVKFQADFEELAKEVRSLLLASTESSPDENVKKPVRKMGRPKKFSATRDKLSSSSTSSSSSIVDRLRNKFFEASNNNTLDHFGSTEGFSTNSCTSTGWEGICTTQSLKISEATIEGTNNSTKSKQPSRSRRTLQIQHEEENMTESLNGQNEDAHMFNDSRPIIIKHEISNELQQQDYAMPDDTNEEDDDTFPSSPPWLPEENEDDGEDLSAPDDGSESDYEPTQSNKRKVKSERKPRKFRTNNASVPDNGNGDRAESDHKPTTSKPKNKSNSEPSKMTKNAATRLREHQLSESLSKVPKTDFGVQPIEENGSFRCPTCDMSISRKIDCRAHILKDHYNDPLPFHCHACDNKRFLKEKNLRKHLYRFHLNAKTPYDEDYDAKIHSMEKLKNMVVEDGSWQPLSRNDIVKDSQEEGPTVNLEEIVNPQLPDDILELFKNDPEGSWPCTLCKRKFASKMLRDGHEKRTHHGIENPFPCPLCHRRFPRRTRLLHHVCVVHFSKNHVCVQCGSRFADKVLLDGHIRRTHFGETNPFLCTVCQRKFPKRAKLNQHLSRVHKIHVPKIVKKVAASLINIPHILRPKSLKNPPDDPIFECWVCSTEGEPMRFNSLEEKEEHMQTLHTSVDKPFKCPAEGCNKRYATHGILQCHIGKVHPEGITVPTEQYYECVECKKIFDTHSKLEAHMESHSSSPFVCDLCGKVYKMQKYLDDHQQQQHHKELKLMPHKCKKCGKILNTAKSLDHHIRMKHTKETTFKCKECDFGTMYAKLLQRHVEIRHLKLAQAMCHICSRSFATQFYLTQHMMRVHEDKRFKCTECGKLFSDPPTFARHMEAHSGKIHECPIETCKKQYNTRHAFRTHLKNHQRKGVMVEIPEVRYQNDPEDVEESNSTTTEKAQTNSDNNFSDLPDLKPEINRVVEQSQSTDVDKDISVNADLPNLFSENNTESDINESIISSYADQQPPTLHVVNHEYESIAFSSESEPS